MSHIQLKELHDSSQILNKLKPILKNNNNNYLTTQTRIDNAGNLIVKGGNHKIGFLPISNEKSPNVVTSSNIQINSDSSESDEDTIQNNINQNRQPIQNLKGKKCQNTQTLIVDQSKCCIIF
ncbi:unnamed protein product [Paramecium sonneborni]|uniref:Uncharacterized protein n=1 Tax=Paramecium sonneborni TaxID=65129 RepID=A0A8S1QYK9_9CILI|nr:unnamed protein product [Paramecium sonneborni]